MTEILGECGSLLQGRRKSNFMTMEIRLDKTDSLEERYLTCHGRTIRWYLRKSAIANTPLMLVFHGNGFVEQPARFANPNWNVLCPMDDFGYERMGCWYLGEDGDFFWLDATAAILDEARKECGQGRLYCWGSSMGGYASLLYGYLHNAFAVYSCIPQTWLHGSSWGLANKKALDPIFGGKSLPITTCEMSLTKDNALFIALHFPVWRR